MKDYLKTNTKWEITKNMRVFNYRRPYQLELKDNKVTMRMQDFIDMQEDIDKFHKERKMVIASASMKNCMTPMRKGKTKLDEEIKEREEMKNVKGFKRYMKKGK